MFNASCSVQCFRVSNAPFKLIAFAPVVKFLWELRSANNPRCRHLRKKLFFDSAAVEVQLLCMRTLHIILFCLALVASLSWGLSERSTSRAKDSYIDTLESVNDTLLTTTYTLEGTITKVTSINGTLLRERDALTKQLANQQVKVVERTRIEIVRDTTYVQSVSVQVEREGSTLHRVQTKQGGISLDLELLHPTGDYSLQIWEDPIRLTIYTGRTPSERHKAYATVQGRPDLTVGELTLEYIEDDRGALRKAWDSLSLSAGALSADGTLTPMLIVGVSRMQFGIGANSTYYAGYRLK